MNYAKTIMNLILPFLTSLVVITGASSWYLIIKYRIPISTIFAGIVTALPVLTYIVTGFCVTSIKSQRRNILRSPMVVALVYLVLLALDVVVMTLSTTFIPVDMNRCPLESSWTEWWKTKNGEAIGAIQNELRCCGLRTSLDKPFPFPSKEIDIHTCQRALKSASSCYVKWQKKMQISGGLLLAVGGILLLVKFVLLLRLLTLRKSSLRSYLALHSSSSPPRYLITEDGEGDEDPEDVLEGQEQNRRIEPYHDDENQPTDRPPRVARRARSNSQTRLLNEEHTVWQDQEEVLGHHHD